MATTQNFNYPSSSDVTITGIGNPTGSPVPADAIYIAGENPSGNLTGIQTDSSGNLIVVPATGSVQHVIVDSSALPAGASTSALQTSGNASLTSIDSKTPALGQALDVASVPVVLTAAQLSTLTPLTSVTVTQATGTNLHAVIDSGTITLSGTSPVSGTVTANQGTANATSWNENIAQVGGASFALGQQLAASSLPIVLTAAQLSTLTPLSSVTVTQATGTNLHVVVDSGTINAKAATPTALTITNAAITVGTSAVRLTVSGSAPSSTRVVLVATPDTASTATFYIGTSTVTNSGATRGIEIAAGQSFIANNDAGDYWIVSSIASQTVTVMEQA